MLTHTDLFDPVTLNMKGDVRIAISSYLQSQFNWNIFSYSACNVCTALNALLHVGLITISVGKN